MLQYYTDITAVAISLLLTNNTDPITGQTPQVMIRNKDTSQYWDFNAAAFAAAPTSATAPMGSSTGGVDGLYEVTWDVSGMFAATTHLIFEYHNGTAVTTEDVLFTTPPLTTASISGVVSGITGGAGGGGGGGSMVELKGIWTAKQKEKLFTRLDEIDAHISEFRKQSVTILRQILTKKQLTKEDLEAVAEIKERDLEYYDAMLHLIGLSEGATGEEFFDKLQDYIDAKQESVEGLLSRINELLDESRKNKIEEVIDKITDKIKLEKLKEDEEDDY